MRSSPLSATYKLSLESVQMPTGLESSTVGELGGEVMAEVPAMVPTLLCQARGTAKQSNDV